VVETRSTWIAGAAAAVVMIALAVPAVRHLREQPPPPPPPVRLAFDAPAASRLGSGDESLDAAISPDGTEILFVATTDGVAGLWRRVLATGQTDRLTGTEGAQFPAWKQTRRTVSFFAGGRLRQLSLADGAIHDLAIVTTPGGASWMPDGSLLFAQGARTPIRRMLSGTVTDATKLAPGDRRHVFPAAAGDTGHFTYVAFRDDGRRTIRLVTADGERDLTDTAGHAQIAGGFLVYARDGVLLARSFDPETGTIGERSTPLAPSVGVSAAGHGMFAASPRLLVYAEGAPRPRDIDWLDLATMERTRVAEPADYWQVRISPDDRRAAVTVVDPLLRTLDVFVVAAAEAGDSQPVSRALAADSDPVWSPDGGTMLFRSMQGGRPMLFTRRVAARGTRDEPLPSARAGDTATDWRGDRILVHTEDTGATGADISMVGSDGGSRQAFASDPFNESDGRWSPDGEWIAYVSDESGEQDIYAARTGRAADRVRVSWAGGTKPRWSRDGLSIFFVRGTQIMRADRGAGSAPRFAAAVPVLDAPGLRDFDVAHRSNRLVLLVPAPASHESSASAILDWASAVAAQ
jgi:serine/threonine-protein kinase